jgi:hypothetical protein
MAFSLARWQETGIIVARGEGSGSLSERLELLEALADQTLVPVLAAVILDLRQLDNLPSADDARQIAEAFGAFSGRHGCRLAYVASAGAQYGVARMIEILSQQQGVAAGAFLTPELALRWLEESSLALGDEAAE